MKPTVMALLIFLFSASLSAQKLHKTAASSVVNGWNFADINAVNATLSNDGVFADYRRTQSAGLEWPKGSNRTAVYSSGLWVIGKHRPTDSIRTAVMMYLSEFQPGKVLSTFNTSTNAASAADDPAKPEYRLYTAVRGQNTGDAANWPVHLGAPYKDINGNGTFDALTDSPVRWGDQTLWTVSNDIAPAAHVKAGATRPLGIELQSTFFSYDVPGPLGSVVFLRYKIINRSDADYDSVCIGYWSDIDMGDANDDMIAADSARSLFYVYNGDNDDAGFSGYGAQPPSTGFLLLQGPAVTTGIATDTARIEGKKRSGRKNLPMTAFAVWFGGGLGIGWNDPPLSYPNFGRVALNNLNGTHSVLGTPVINPVTGAETKYAFTGDPVTGMGWNQGESGINPADVRGVMGSGPFTLAMGDTQEVVVAYLIAKGTDRLNSIVKLREAADAARAAYLGDFTSPILTVQGPNVHRPVPVSSFTFGRRKTGESGDTLRYRVMNIGQSVLTLQFSALTQTAFVRTQPPGTSVPVPPGGFADVAVGFLPTEGKVYVDSLVVTSDDTTDARFVLPVSGTGVVLSSAVSGALYAANGTSLYSLSSGSGTASLTTPFEAGLTVTGCAVRPSNGELYGIWNGGVARISTGGAYHIKLPHPLTGYTLSGGTVFMNDSLLAFAADSIIARMNVRTGVIDTVHRFTNGHRVQSLAFAAGSSSFYYAIKTLFGTSPDTADVTFRLDATTKQVTRLGRALIGVRLAALLCDKNGKLYALADSGSGKPVHLITVNTTTGRGTLLGSTGVTGLTSLAMDPNSVAGVRPEPGVLPSAFALHQNFPNPFNPSTVITYDVPVTGDVRLEVFDLLGRKTATLVNEVQTAGRYSVRADGTALGLSSGVYIYALRSGSFSSARKMSLVK